MNDSFQIIELIGFDILFVGLATMLTCLLASSLFRTRMAGHAMVEGLQRFLDYLSKQSFVTLVALVIGAAAAGNVLIVVSDGMLDSSTPIGTRAFLFVPSLDKTGERSAWRGHWLEEDLLKAKALEDVATRIPAASSVAVALTARLETYRASLLNRDIDAMTPAERDGLELDDVKGFLQHAKATVEARGNESVVADLRRGLTSIKLLSSLFVDTLVLLLAYALGALVRLALWLRSMLRPGRDASAEPATWKGVPALVTGTLVRGLVLWFFIGGFLRLWTADTIGWNKRVLHAYVVLAAEGDPVMGIAKAPASLHAAATDSGGK